MKKGDKFLCKRNLHANDDEIIFKIGEYYEIDYVDDNGEEVRIVYSDNDWTYAKFYWMYIDKTDFIEHRLYDYFYSDKELRKIKLEQIEKGR